MKRLAQALPPRYISMELHLLERWLNPKFQSYFAKKYNLNHAQVLPCLRFDLSAIQHYLLAKLCQRHLKE